MVGHADHATSWVHVRVAILPCPKHWPFDSGNWQEKATGAKDDGFKRGKEKMKSNWVGLTIFYMTGEGSKKKERFLDTPDGLIRVKLSAE